MNESNGQTADLYGWLNRQADVRRQQITVLNKEIGDLEAAMAAVAARQPTPVAPQVDVQQCHCGGWLAPKDGVWVHERDGGIACQPGHSGPVAQPLPATTSFPQVTQQDGTQVIPYIARYPDFVGHRVVVVLDDGTGRDGMAYEGLFELDSNGGSRFCLGEMDGESSFMIRELAEIRSIRLVEPADLDQVPATPAASVTLPDEAGA